jgi:hypothetical protein
LFDVHPAGVPLDELFRGGGPVVGDDDGGGVAAEAGDDELPDGAGVVGQGRGFVDDAGVSVVAVAVKADGAPGGAGAGRNRSSLRTL